MDDDEEEYDNSMRTFTAARLENSASVRNNTKLKIENSATRNDSAENVKEGGNPGLSAVAPAGVNSGTGIVVKEDTVKNIFTENIQTSGAYSAREESLKRE